MKQLISFSERRETDKDAVVEAVPEYDEVEANRNNRNEGMCSVVCSENLSFDGLNLALLVVVCLFYSIRRHFEKSGIIEFLKLY